MRPELFLHDFQLILFSFINSIHTYAKNTYGRFFGHLADRKHFFFFNLRMALAHLSHDPRRSRDQRGKTCKRPRVTTVSFHDNHADAAGTSVHLRRETQLSGLSLMEISRVFLIVIEVCSIVLYYCKPHRHN